MVYRLEVLEAGDEGVEVPGPGGHRVLLHRPALRQPLAQGAARPVAARPARRQPQAVQESGGGEGEEEEEGEEGVKGEAGVNILQKNLEIFRAVKRVISSYPRKADRKTSKNSKMYYRVIF